MSIISVKSQVDINLDLKFILEGIDQLDTLALESFANKVNLLVAKRKVPSLSKKETTLLRKINKGIPVQKSKRLLTLQTKSKSGSLSVEEETELTKVIDYVEELEVKRLQNMIALAKIWKMSLEQLREKLGIPTPPVHVW